MRLMAPQRSLRRILRWTQRGLLACAVAMLGYCGFVFIDTWVFEKKEHRQIDRMLTESVSAVAPKASPPVAQDGLIGRIEIPRVGISVAVMEGTGRLILRRAVGHISGTALPGEPGNAGIAGHRDTFFRTLREIRENDIVTLTTPRGKFRYRVVSTKVVSPNDVAVLNPGVDQVLTLVTCFPFYFVGAAPDRFIVRAERII